MAGYSSTPLVQKLGIKPGAKLKIVQEPEDYWKWISPLPDKAEPSAKAPYDFVHLFVTSRKKFESEVLKLRAKLHPDGMIWVSWPKKASKVETDLDENCIRDFALKNKLVDIKVCAVSEVWSGLKLVIPVKDRKA
jgi:bifunctional DNA-binding transcriptional regulator/antitoxin component of YhaV-PrlF toxin-antitoxin module